MSATVIAPAPDLFTPGTLTTADGIELPLVSVSAAADVAGLLATWRITQRYTNPTDDAVEVTYTFPLPGRFAVRDVVFVVGDRRIRADLAERGEARERYEEAVAQGHAAALVEEDRPEVFTVTVGNLAAAASAEVELTLAGRVPVVDGTAELRLPTLVAERFVDAAATPDAHRLAAPRVLAGAPSAQVPFAVEASIDSPAVSVSAPEGFTVAGGPGAWRLASPAGWVPGRDAIIRWDQSGSPAPYASVVSDRDAGLGSEGHTVAVTIPAPVSAPSGPRDVVVVLDRSGSMGGMIGGTEESTKMDVARRAAARLVDSLCDDDRVSVVAFDHELTTPWEGWRPATDDNRFAAMRFIAAAEARGFTMLPEALTEALARFDADRSRAKVVVVITDALVGAEDATVRSIAGRVSGLCVHGVTVGPFGNAGLLDRLADATGGTSVVVEDSVRLDEALDGLRRRVAPPALSGVRIVDPEVAESSPRHPDVHVGIPLVVAGRVAEAPHQVVVEALDAAGAVQRFVVPVATTENPAVHAAWARARVRDLEDLRVAGIAEAGADAPPTAEAIVAHSVAHRVLSRYTAFVAVDEDGDRLEAPATTELAQALAGYPVMARSGGGSMLRSMNVAAAPAGVPLTEGLADGLTGVTHSVSSMSYVCGSTVGESWGGSLGGPGGRLPGGWPSTRQRALDWDRFLGPQVTPPDPAAAELTALAVLLEAVGEGRLDPDEFLARATELLSKVHGPWAALLLEALTKMVERFKGGDSSAAARFWDRPG